jgi:hypothetical protein
LPSITGISDPTTQVQPAPAKLRLAWWQILLMVLGCVFIFCFVMWCFRRRMMKKRKAKTEKFAQERGLPHKGSWKTRFLAFGERFFGHRNRHFNRQLQMERQRAMGAGMPMDTKGKGAMRERQGSDASFGNVEAGRGGNSVKMTDLKSMQQRIDAQDKEIRDQRSRMNEMEKEQIYGTYGDLRSHHSRSTTRSSYYPEHYESSKRSYGKTGKLVDTASTHSHSHSHSNPVDLEQLRTEPLYSHVTGEKRKVPEPRQPYKQNMLLHNLNLGNQRLSASTWGDRADLESVHSFGSKYSDSQRSYPGARSERLKKPPRQLTEAGTYADEHWPRLMNSSSAPLLGQQRTGGSKNPFDQFV